MGKRYQGILESAWGEHLKPKAPDAPTVISTFAGAGGSSLGYSMAGFQELMAVEWEDDAAKTFRENFPEVPLYHGDVAAISVEDCLQLSGMKPGELDVFDGSPPCQGFSSAGKRQIDDPRNSLFREYVRLLKGLSPKVFVMENVRGMVKGKMIAIYAEIMKELKSAGYRVSTRLMNTKFFNVPQARERTIFIEVREDLGIEPSHPKAMTAPIVFGDACFDLRHSEEEHRLLPEFLLQYAKVHPGGWGTNVELYEKIKGNRASCFSTQWAEWNRVLGTIIKQEIASCGIVHPDKKRYLSLSECKRCGSFPDPFKFTNRSKGVERIGNSVPPLFMRAIARHIRESILDK